MKNFSTGLFGRLFLNAVTLESRSPGSVVINKRNTTNSGTLRAARHSSMTLCDERRGGFTLIELLVVVLIIGILSAIALPQYNRAVLRARFTQAQTLARNFADAATRYYLANGEPPGYWADMDISKPSGWNDDGRYRGSVGGKNTSCDLMNNDAKNIVCFIHWGGTLYLAAYVQFFGPDGNARECWAKADNNDAQSLCKGLGGQKTGTSLHASCTGCDIYTLP